MIANHGLLRISARSFWWSTDRCPFTCQWITMLPDWQAAAAEAEEHHNATHRPLAPACPRGVFSPHCTSSSTLMTAPQENHLWNSWSRTMTSTHADRRWCSQNLELNPLKPVKMTVDFLERVYKLQTIFIFLCSFLFFFCVLLQVFWPLFNQPFPPLIGLQLCLCGAASFLQPCEEQVQSIWTSDWCTAVE